MPKPTSRSREPRVIETRAMPRTHLEMVRDELTKYGWQISWINEQGLCSQTLDGIDSTELHYEAHLPNTTGRVGAGKLYLKLIVSFGPGEDDWVSLPMQRVWPITRTVKFAAELAYEARLHQAWLRENPDQANRAKKMIGLMGVGGATSSPPSDDPKQG